MTLSTPKLTRAMLPVSSRTGSTHAIRSTAVSCRCTSRRNRFRAIAA
jgi:hypothetical protein